MTNDPTITRRQPGSPLDATMAAMEERILQLLPVDHGFVLLLVDVNDIAMSSNLPPSMSHPILRSLVDGFDRGLVVETVEQH